MIKHTLMGGKLHVYKREGSEYWQCATYLSGKNRRTTTKERNLAEAKSFAEDWFLELHGKYKRGEIKNEKTFRMAAKQFLREFEIITQGQRNERYVENHHARLRRHLLPFFGDMGLSKVTSGQVQEYRIYRKEKALQEFGKPPAWSTMHQEIVVLRQVLKTAVRHGWLTHLPDLSEAYKNSTKISHRAWFSPDEYKQLYTATRNRMKNPPRKRYQWEYAQLHDYVLFMANTGLRPDEAMRLEHRDVNIVHDEATKETILEISVRGKRGVGFCKSTSGAVRPYERLRDREKPEYIDANKGIPSSTDLVFPKTHRDLLNKILEEEKLKFDREEQRRTAYSLRHTYICFRLMEGADIYQIAKNCRTSVEMIEKYYASHIKTNLDAAAINVKKQR